MKGMSNMLTLGKWYIAQEPSYRKWSKRERLSIMKFRTLAYGLPALGMVALIIDSYYVW